MEKHRDNLKALEDKEDDMLIGLENKELMKMDKSDIDKEFEDMKLEDFIEPDINQSENILKD